MNFCHRNYHLDKVNKQCCLRALPRHCSLQHRAAHIPAVVQTAVDHPAANFFAQRDPEFIPGDLSANIIPVTASTFFWASPLGASHTHQSLHRMRHQL